MSIDRLLLAEITTRLGHEVMVEHFGSEIRCAESQSTLLRRWRCALPPLLFDRMYLVISFRKSTRPQNRQLKILIGNSKQ